MKKSKGIWKTGPVCPSALYLYVRDTEIWHKNTQNDRDKRIAIVKNLTVCNKTPQLFGH